MTMGAIHRLTTKQINAAGDGMHADGGNLYLRKAGTAASWIFRFFCRIHKKPFDLGIGKYPEVSIERGRRRAFEYRVRIIEGVDVAAEHKRTRHEAVTAAAVETSPAPAGYTFERAAEECIASQEAGWTRQHSEQWTNTLATYAFPVIGAMAIDKVDTDDVLRVLKPIWHSKNETALRTRTRIERVLDWAKAKGLRDKDKDNPARWKGHLKHLLPNGRRQVEHFEAVPVKDIPKFMAQVRASKRVSARALELLCLTATRTNEVRQATFGEFDLADRVWTIPGARTKTRKEHVVPLSDAAIALVKRQLAAAKDRSPSGFLFVGERKGAGLIGINQMKVIMQTIHGGDAVPHGLRSSFRDWCALNGHPRDLAELSLAHVVGSKVERSYRRNPLVEQRRAIMAAWAEYCGRI
jgi:integrase